MGYKIGSIANLPVLNGETLYVFVLGASHWEGGGIEKIANNFDRLAKEFGSGGAIIMGHEGTDLSYDIVMAMYENGPEGIQELIIDGDRSGGALLILDKHPSMISKNDLVLFAPLAHLERRFGGIDKLLSELCSYAAKPNDDFVKLFESSPEGMLSNMLKYFELKPNIAGIGINLNALLEKNIR